MRPVTPVELLGRLHDTLEDLGIRDTHGAIAEAIAESVRASGHLEPDVAARCVPKAQLTSASLSRSAVSRALAAALADVVLTPDFPLLIPAEDIDSFELTGRVDPTIVAGLQYPLRILEDDIKAALLRILGEPFEQEHSPSELSDIFTPRVRLGGRSVIGAFMLKGRGLSGPLRARNAGAMGNQVTKLARTGAELLVVQHVHEIDMDIRTQLSQAIAYLRMHGHPRAVGSAWDGADTARVLLAYDLLEVTGTKATIRLDN